MSGLLNPFLKTIFGDKTWHASPKVRKNLLRRIVQYSSKWTRKILDFDLKSDAFRNFPFDFFFSVNENYDAWFLKYFVLFYLLILKIQVKHFFPIIYIYIKKQKRIKNEKHNCFSLKQKFHPFFDKFDG